MHDTALLISLAVNGILLCSLLWLARELRRLRETAQQAQAEGQQQRKSEEEEEGNDMHPRDPRTECNA